MPLGSQKISINYLSKNWRKKSKYIIWTEPHYQQGLPNTEISKRSYKKPNKINFRQNL